jgi:hypothetical protein
MSRNGDRGWPVKAYTLPPRLIREISREASAEHEPQSRFVQQACEAYLNRRHGGKKEN